MMSWFEVALDAWPDPRTGNAKRHDLLEILTITLTATVCGAESCADIADFAVDREALFRSFLRLENGVPRHDTFLCVFRLLDPAAFAACFGRFLEGLGAAGAGVIAIDGKTLRRSFDGAARSNPLAVVTHELDWLRGPKTASSEPVLLPDMACLGPIEATVEHRGKTTVTRHYHVASRTLSATDYLAAARAHWSVEKGLHWILDVIFDEDRARNRKDLGPENLATLRKFALNILNCAHRNISVRRKRKRSGWSDEFAGSILGQMR